MKELGDKLSRSKGAPLLAGAAKIDITPENSLRLAGFGDRQGNYVGVCEHIYVRCLYLQQLETRILLFSGDLIWWGSDLVSRIKEALKDAFDVDPDAVYLTATHNHSGPPTDFHAVPSLETFNKEYAEFLFEQVMEAANQAIQMPKPVSITRWEGDCHLNVNRRLILKDEVLMAPNYGAPTDSSLDVLCLKDEKGQMVSCVHRYACHATVAAENKVHPEYPGIANRLLDEAYPGCVSIFLQGATGDLRPNVVLGDQFIKLGYLEACAFAKRYADIIQTLLISTGKNLAAQLGFKREILQLPLKDQCSDKQLRDIISNSPAGSLDTLWANQVLENGNPSTQECEINLLKIAENCKFITLNAELVQYYSQFSKQVDAHCILVCYTNGMIGYLCSAKEFREGGYEPDESHKWFALSGPYDPAIQGEIENSISRLLDK